jgi:hypothetical protein
MKLIRPVAVLVFAAVVSDGAAAAQNLSRYRSFQLGTTVESVAKAANMGPSDARVIHGPPALVQELDWRPQYQRPWDRLSMDPVLAVTLTFYNDQLLGIAVLYDESKTEGLTNADVIEALSARYGLAVVPLTPATRSRPSEDARNDAVTIARWADANTTVTLSRGVSSGVFRLLVSSTAVNALAAAPTEDRLIPGSDDALQREDDRGRQEVADAIAAQDGARRRNKVTFRP